jgi:ABC-type multidrug transport system fused ATPase/permease subunit
MPQKETPVVKRSLFSWILEGNLKLQLLLLIVIVGAVFARVLPLEMQKRIVNEAIRLKEIQLLLTYCGIYLVSVTAASALKYLINVLQTYIAERTLARMRQRLFQHILMLPLNFFRKTQPGTVVSTLMTELNIPANFAGMAIANPITNVLTLLAFAVYLFWLNPLLAAVSLSIYPIVLFLVPFLQTRVNRANKKRVDAARKFSARSVETFTGIHEVHANGAYQLEHQKTKVLIDNLKQTRIVWSLYKFAVKTVNNFFTSLGPFLVFILGGYLAIKGQLELGAMVAFLSAQEKLYDPWKELIEFFQVYQDARVTYRRTMDLFDVAPEHALLPHDRPPYCLPGRIDIKDMSFVTDTGIQLLDKVNFSLQPGEHLAIVGFSGSGKSTLAQCVGQLYSYTGGSLKIGEHEVETLSKQDIAHSIGYISQDPFIFDGTIRDNLLYSCLAIADGSDTNLDSSARFEQERPKESQAIPTRDDIISVLQQTGIFVDVLRFGLNTILTTEAQYSKKVSQLIGVRNNFQRDFGSGLEDIVEFFDESKYHLSSSVAANIIFGTANDPSYQPNNLSLNYYFRKFLDENGLTPRLMVLGAELANATVDILSSLPTAQRSEEDVDQGGDEISGSPGLKDLFYAQSPIQPDELKGYQTVTEHYFRHLPRQVRESQTDWLLFEEDESGQIKQKTLDRLSPEEREKCLILGLRYTPAKHKMISRPDGMRAMILKKRKQFRRKIAQDYPDVITFYERSQYLYSQTILNNILFGKITTVKPDAQDNINQSIIQLLIEEDILEDIVDIGLEYHVGSKGDKLSGGQRQKLAIARALLKASRILIMDEATSALDNKSQARIQNLIDVQWRGQNTIIAVVHRLDTIKKYNWVAVMKAGKIVEFGPYDQLIDKKGMLYELVGGKA